MSDVTFLIQNAGSNQTKTLKCDLQMDEIGDLKEKIEEMYNHPVDRQRFFLKGVPLLDEEVLNTYGYKTGDQIVVEILQPTTVEIIHTEKSATFDYKKEDRVESLIAKVAKEWNVKENQVQLVNYMNVRMRDKGSLLSAYGVDGNDEKRRRIRLQIDDPDIIDVHLTEILGGTLSIDIPASATTAELKEKYGALISKVPSQIRLVFLGRQLNDENTLSSVKIQNGSVIYAADNTVGGGFYQSPSFASQYIMRLLQVISFV